MRLHRAFLRFFFLLVILSTTTNVLHAQSLYGSWKGILDVGMVSLNLVFHIEKDLCKMDSPDQGAKDIPTEIRFLSDDSIHIEIPVIAASYVGRLQGDVLKGTFTQQGYSFPLDLERGTVVRNRPQTPQPPFSYTTEEVSFVNEKAQAKLAGTITYPIGYNPQQPVPVAIMVTGSGLQNRDEEIMEHKPFLVIADYLARHGIATLRYDDRGFASSTGDVKNSTTKDYMEDAETGINFLRNSGKFSHVGIIGHSEGGLIAFMLAAKKKVDFMVGLAAPALQGDSIITEQNNHMLRKQGREERMTVQQTRTVLAMSGLNAWVKFFIDYNPAQDIALTTCPAMIINGEKDTQVMPASNFETIKRLLPHSEKNFFKLYPALNHLFQHCTTGDLEEYNEIEETISEEVLHDIASWIQKITK